MDPQATVQGILHYAAVIAIMLAVAYVGQRSREFRKLARPPVRREPRIGPEPHGTPGPKDAPGQTEGLRLDLASMAEVVREWIAFVGRTRPGPLEVRDTRELPRRKGEIALALYTVHHQGKTQAIRDGALVYLDVLAQFQDDVGAPVMPSERASQSAPEAERWTLLHRKVLDDRARLRAVFKTLPIAGRRDTTERGERPSGVPAAENRAADQMAAGSHDRTIPLTIGFANLSGEDASALVADDVAILAPLFAQAAVPPAGEIPRAPILFVYAHLDEDGAIPGMEQTGVREIAQAAGAALVVVATANPAARVQKAASASGPKTANIVLTLDRNGRFFGTFFKTLFDRMATGEEMLLAWTGIAPQGPVRRPDVPATILLVEAGGLAFPNSRADEPTPQPASDSSGSPGTGLGHHA